MKKSYKILRFIIICLLGILFLTPAILYLALSLPSVQRYICNKTESELSTLLAVDVNIDHVQISPFSRVTLHRVTIDDANKQHVLKVQRLGAGINLWDYMAHNRIVLNYAELIGMEANIYRDSIGSPLNIQPIIDALSPKDKSKPPTKFDFKINNVVIRTSSIRYNVLSVPTKESGFDPSHININDFSADIRLPQMKNDDFFVELRRLTFSEESGLQLSNLSGDFHISSSGISINNLSLELPYSLLSFADFGVNYNGWDALNQKWKELPINLHLENNSHISTNDIASFIPSVTDLSMNFDTRIHIKGTANDIVIDSLQLSSQTGALINIAGNIKGLTDSITAIRWEIPTLEARFNGTRAVSAVSHFTSLKNNLRGLMSNLGNVVLNGSAVGGMTHGNFDVDITSAIGNILLRTDYSGIYPNQSITKGIHCDGSIEVSEFSGEKLMTGLSGTLADINNLSAAINYDFKLHKKAPTGTADVVIDQLIFRNNEFNDIIANISSDGNIYKGAINLDNSGVLLNAIAEANIKAPKKTLSGKVKVQGLDLSIFNTSPTVVGKKLSFSADAELNGSNVDDIEGHFHIFNLQFIDNNGNGTKLDNICINSHRSDSIDSLTIKSDIIDGKIEGKYHLSTIANVGKELLSQTLPALINNNDISDDFWEEPQNKNHFNYCFVLKSLNPLGDLVKLPVKVIDPIKLNGNFNTINRGITLNVNAPYLLQGTNKVIERTMLNANIYGATVEDPLSRSNLMFTTSVPTKKGMMTLNTEANAIDNQIDTKLTWKIDRERNFSGEINTSTKFSRNENNELRTDLTFNPSQLVFNDTIWDVKQSHIYAEGKVIDIDDFKVGHADQHITINGRASELPTDTITLSLMDVSLDYVFETLDIPTAMFGGNATGNFYATELLTKSPSAYTPGLDVKQLTYNYSLMGDAIIRAEWLADVKAVGLHADISQTNGRKSYVDGKIFPFNESLDLTFDADKINVEFLLPYMSAFAKDIQGYASGKARLWGTFKLIDMVGDIYGEDIKLTLGFTNTSYTTTDSVRLTPGRIGLDNLTLYDDYGNTAKLNGWLTHECFKSPRFEFLISDARNLLVYDMKENNEQPWYGRVFGSGGASVNGQPGLVEIGVDMTTTENSAFTYVLSNALKAQEYNFITFRDRDQARKDSIAALNAPPALVQQIKSQANSNSATSSSDYRMTFNVDITPQALITLVMDPVGGDRIKAHGNGILSLSYDSSSEDLRMNGTYTLEEGSYNFTLQDIIIKDFTINSGSTISFLGDPYAAQLNLTALYQVRGANLTDLDESFLEDKELNRTNVPVNALLKVRGDMRQPEIGFDLDFPSLTEETKRKVLSIVNTEEMMNRQIIYLLALNRFYTPDYMTATRGNEFVSVASSTISSQLSSMLGQLSDSWDIAPNFRSSRGDFSDVEVDVALSSHLLNNRLLLNGNLGYRDKTLNNNSFIGDFDIEYLLNRSGTLRLKAYNRYNDQNYYLKSALTTQGVGIVVKRDFDSMTSFLKKFRRKKADTTPSDTLPDTLTITPQQPDTIPTPTNN